MRRKRAAPRVSLNCTVPTDAGRIVDNGHVLLGLGTGAVEFCHRLEEGRECS